MSNSPTLHVRNKPWIQALPEKHLECFWQLFVLALDVGLFDQLSPILDNPPNEEIVSR